LVDVAAIPPFVLKRLGTGGDDRVVAYGNMSGGPGGYFLRLLRYGVRNGLNTAIAGVV
jgi:hypothetical protein